MDNVIKRTIYQKLQKQKEKVCTQTKNAIRKQIEESVNNKSTGCNWSLTKIKVKSESISTILYKLNTKKIHIKSNYNINITSFYSIKTDESGGPSIVGVLVSLSGAMDNWLLIYSILSLSFVVPYITGESISLTEVSIVTVLISTSEVLLIDRELSVLP